MIKTESKSKLNLEKIDSSDSPVLQAFKTIINAGIGDWTSVIAADVEKAIGETQEAIEKLACSENYVSAETERQRLNKVLVLLRRKSAILEGLGYSGIIRMRGDRMAMWKARMECLRIMREMIPEIEKAYPYWSIEGKPHSESESVCGIIFQAASLLKRLL